MMTVLELIDPIARVAMEALLNSLWQGLALAALVWGLLRVIRQTNSTTRYAVWWTTLLAVVCLPLLVRWASSNDLETMHLTTSDRPSVEAPLVPLSESGEVAYSATRMTASASPSGELGGTSGKRDDRSLEARDQSRPMRARFPVQLWSGRWSLYLFGGWLLVAAGMLARLVWSYGYVQRLKRRCSPLPPKYQHQLQRWLTASRTGRPVRLCSSSEVSVPTTVGLMNPAILLPETLADQLSEAQVDQIGLHELAHLRRWDDWTNLVQKLAEAVFFFHPAVLWIGQRLNLEREIACDDWVISLTGEPRSYAACLTKLVELTTWPRHPALVSGAALTRNQISRRIEMVLDKKRDATLRLSKVGLLTTLGVLIVAVAYCAQVSPVIAVPERTSSVVEPADQEKTPEPEIKTWLRTTEGGITSRWSEGFTQVEVRAKGDLEFTEDHTDIKSISQNGYLLIEERHEQRGYSDK